MEIVLVGEVVGRVDVLVSEKAVGHEKIIGLVAGEGDALDDKDQRAGVIDQKGGDEHPAKLFFEGQAPKAGPPFFEEERPVLEDPGIVGEL
jgi:hypothetical protein